MSLRAVADPPDQAAGLRALAAQRRGRPAAERAARVVAVTSGKGGTGKSNLAANLAYLLARSGVRTALADLDLGLANLDVLLGLHPSRTLGHLLDGRATLQDVLVVGPGGMKFLPGATGVERIADLDPAGRDRLLALLEPLEREADVLILDTGAGVGQGVLSFLEAADEILLVTTPEPTAILDAFALLKILASRLGAGAGAGVPPGRVRVVVNQASDRDQAARVAARLAEVSARFLGLPVERLGYVLHDLQVPEAVRQRRLVSEAWPRAAASRCLTAIARQIAPARAQGRGSFFRRWFSFRSGAKAPEPVR